MAWMSILSLVSSLMDDIKEPIPVPEENLSPYALGQKAYFQGKNVYDIPSCQSDGWWDAKVLVENGIDHDRSE